MKLFIAFVLIAVVSASSTSRSFSKNVNCNLQDINSVVIKDCTWTGNLTVSVDDTCTISLYEKRTVTGNQSTTAIVNNGIALCTQQPCDKTTEAVPIDCVTAFGADIIEEIASPKPQ